MESAFGKRTRSASVAPALRPILPEPRLKVLLVDFHRGKALSQHPDVAPLLEQGWEVKSVAPRVVEAEGLKLLVVLQRPRRRLREALPVQAA